MKDQVTNVLRLASLVRENVQTKQLLTPYNPILVTLSGGQDSICSLLFLYLLQDQLGLTRAVIRRHAETKVGPYRPASRSHSARVISTRLPEQSSGWLHAPAAGAVALRAIGCEAPVNRGLNNIADISAPATKSPVLSPFGANRNSVPACRDVVSSRVIQPRLVNKYLSRTVGTRRRAVARRLTFVRGLRSSSIEQDGELACRALLTEGEHRPPARSLVCRTHSREARVRAPYGPVAGAVTRFMGVCSSKVSTRTRAKRELALGLRTSERSARVIAPAAGASRRRGSHPIVLQTHPLVERMRAHSRFARVRVLTEVAGTDRASSRFRLALKGPKRGPDYAMDNRPLLGECTQKVSKIDVTSFLDSYSLVLRTQSREARPRRRPVRAANRNVVPASSTGRDKTLPNWLPCSPKLPEHTTPADRPWRPRRRPARQTFCLAQAGSAARWSRARPHSSVGRVSRGISTRFDESSRRIDQFGLLWCNHFWQKESFHTMLHVAKLNLCFSSPMYFFLPIDSVLCEQYARDWRHKSIQRTCAFFHYECCTQGHTKSDRVETILFNLLRGTGVAGLQMLQWKKSFYSFSCQRFYPHLSFSKLKWAQLTAPLLKRTQELDKIESSSTFCLVNVGTEPVFKLPTRSFYQPCRRVGLSIAAARQQEQ